jgi:hypothetical protein
MALTSEDTKMVSELERVYSDGIMAKSLKEIGKKE